MSKTKYTQIKQMVALEPQCGMRTYRAEFNRHPACYICASFVKKFLKKLPPYLTITLSTKKRKGYFECSYNYGSVTCHGKDFGLFVAISNDIESLDSDVFWAKISPLSKEKYMAAK